MGGTLKLLAGSGPTQGTLILADPTGSAALTVDTNGGTNIKVNAPIIGATGDALRFGILDINVNGLTSITVSDHQYINFNLRFHGTPAAATFFTVFLPAIDGWTKFIDLSAVNTSNFSQYAIDAGPTSFAWNKGGLSCAIASYNSASVTPLHVNLL